MVISFPEYIALTPAGRPVDKVIPTTPDVVCVILVSSVFTHKVGELDADPTEQVTTAAQELKSKGFPGIFGYVSLHPKELVLLSYSLPLEHTIRAGLQKGLTLGVPHPIVPVPLTFESFKTFKTPVTLTSPVIIAPPLPQTDISPGTVTSPSKVATPSAFIERFEPTVKAPSV